MDTQSVTIHPKGPAPPSAPPSTALPSLIQTPAGLALLELQGAFNLPAPDHDGPDDHDEDGNAVTDRPQEPVHIGRIEFPDYDDASKANPKEHTAWMRRVQLYVGPHQRLTGEVKKLPRPLAVVRRRTGHVGQGQDAEKGSDMDLEVVEVIHYKLLFSNRPEPMTESGPV